MQKHKKHVHSRRKKTLKKVGWIVLAVVIILAVGSWAWGSTLVQSRVQASFGNNAAYQKKEYDKQRALAKKKYGDTAKNTAVVKEKPTAKESSSASKTNSSTKKTASDQKYIYITVKQGEYLSTIANNYNTTVDKLVELNDLESRDISAGVQLKVPANGNTSTGNSADSSVQ